MDTPHAAQAYLRGEGANAVAVLVDCELASGDARTWLTRLRESIAWTGLPVVFLVNGECGGLPGILQSFKAPMLPRHPDPQQLEEARRASIH